MIEPGTRRGFLSGLAALVAAPALVRADSLMKITGVVQPWPRDHRWLAAYLIGTDRVALRVDTIVGVGAPPNPLRGAYVPSEAICRELDRRYGNTMLQALYDQERREPANFTQIHVTVDAPGDILAKMRI